MNKSESKYFNTALLMNEALLLLLETKDYEFITVTEICKKNIEIVILTLKEYRFLGNVTLNIVDEETGEIFNSNLVKL